ncbi:MAG: hypothetical protein ACK6A8_00050 [Planctomycetota bacterium]
MARCFEEGSENPAGNPIEVPPELRLCFAGVLRNRRERDKEPTIKEIASSCRFLNPVEQDGPLSIEENFVSV